ncbi:MAG TPA: hypothetical protein VGP64_16290 [Polyangia bacterium]
MNAGPADDFLARSVRALRREQVLAVTPVAPIGDDALGGCEHTWLRIADDVRRTRAVRRWISLVAVQVVLGLAGATVWGAATGRLQPAVRAAAAAVGGLVTPGRHARPAPRRSPALVRDVESGDAGHLVRSAPAPIAQPLVAAPPAPQVPSVRRGPRAMTPPRPAPAPATGASAGATRATHEPPVFEPAPAPEAHAPLALYREAHRLHFVERDYAEALGAWDRYLAAGSGPLVLEARYNRAIALAHLGRREEAVAALRPFADSARGGYRRQEALALIAALGVGTDSHLRDP